MLSKAPIRKMQPNESVASTIFVCHTNRIPAVSFASADPPARPDSPLGLGSISTVTPNAAAHTASAR